MSILCTFQKFIDYVLRVHRQRCQFCVFQKFMDQILSILGYRCQFCVHSEVHGLSFKCSRIVYGSIVYHSIYTGANFVFPKVNGLS